MSSLHNLLALLAFLLTSCAVHKPAQETVRDSVVMTIRDSVIIRDSIVFVALPEGSASAKLPDTDTSRLQTSLAESEAFVSDGRIHHTLRNRSDALLPVTVQFKERLRAADKSLVRYQRIVEKVEVEKELSKWQRFIMSLGYGLLVSLTIWIAIKLSKIIR